MFPGGMNPKAMQQAMKKMGIQQQEIAAESVVIRCRDKDIIIENPEVSRVNMMGQMTYQIVGNAKEQKRKNEDVIEVTEEDLKTIMEQAGVSEDEAMAALEVSEGDIAQAIMNLTEKK